MSEKTDFIKRYMKQQGWSKKKAEAYWKKLGRATHR